MTMLNIKLTFTEWPIDKSNLSVNFFYCLGVCGKILASGSLLEATCGNVFASGPQETCKLFVSAYKSNS